MDNITKLSPLDKIVIIRKCTGLSAIQKSILYSIASREGENSFCYPGLSTLMVDTGIKHRTSLIENLSILAELKILWINPPNKEFKSNQYKIDFELLVRVAHQCSALGALDQCVTRTRAVRKAHPKRNTNKKLKEIKKEPSLITAQAEEAKEKIRRICGIKKK